MTMNNHVFHTLSTIPPDRWRAAFPAARVVAEVTPGDLPPRTLLWLHQVLPESLPAAVRAALTADSRIIVMDNEPSDERGLAALGQGASGYCNTHADPEVLRQIAAVIDSGGVWVGESLLGRLLGSLNSRSVTAEKLTENPLLGKLSERERDVAIRVVRGESNKEISRDLNIAERTVKAHLTAAFDKLGVRDRLQLALRLNTAK